MKSWAKCRVSRILAGVSVAMAVAAGAVVPAHATPITGSLSFTATGFGAGAPHDPVVGTVTFSFDNAAPFFNAADGAIVNGVVVDVNVFGLSLPGAWVPVLTYINNAMVQDVLAIGHSLNGTVVNPGTDDWRVAFNNISTNPTFREFAYSTSSSQSVFVTTTGTASAVPEPATLTLLGVGLAAIRVARRRARN